ncbi:MAG: serpin family protein, partial [Terriglobales bacterium]
MKCLTVLVCFALTAGSHYSPGQELPGHRLTDFIHANETFGETLFRQVHAANANGNAIISPLPTYYILGAIGRGSSISETGREIWHVLGWDNGVVPIGPSRLLFERFRPDFSSEPKPSPSSRGSRKEVHVRSSLLRSRESMWMATAFIYRGRNAIDDYFIREANGEFGMQMVNVAERGDLEPAIERWWKEQIPRPAVIGPSDFYAVGTMHLQTVWAGNTFSKSTTHKDDFILRSGVHESVDMMPSALSSYSHVRTDTFEAAMLRCFAVDLLIVLPAEGKDILQLETELANHPGEVDPLLKREPGTIDLPKFAFQLEADLRPALEELGVHRIFTDLDIVNIPKSHLKEMKQRVDIEVDEEGMRANA